MASGGSQPPPRRARLALLKALTGVAAAAVALVGGELLLRSAGHAPRPASERSPATPAVTEPDPELGWRQRPVRLVHPPVSPAASPFRLTVLDDGTRDSGRRAAARPAPSATPEPPGEPTVWALGGSFTQGWGVSDDQTFVWRLQRRRPGWRFVNRAVPAYGTVQSWRTLERSLAREPAPDAVLYGLIGDHARRNVGTPEWIRHLDLNRRGSRVRFPICRLDADGRLACARSRPFPRWPLGGRLASVHLAETLHGRLRARGRRAQQIPVTEAVLGELARTARQAGARLLVALLHGPPPVLERLEAFLRERGIPVADCRLPPVAGFTLPGDVHPSARGHARYAACLEPRLASLLGEGGAR